MIYIPVTPASHTTRHWHIATSPAAAVRESGTPRQFAGQGAPHNPTELPKLKKTLSTLDRAGVRASLPRQV